MSWKTRTDPTDAVAFALADGTRRDILRMLRDHARTAGQVAEGFPSISRPAVSQHLRVLREAGLVSVRPEGRCRSYRAQPAALAPISSFVDEMWTRALPRLKTAAEQLVRSEP